MIEVVAEIVVDGVDGIDGVDGVDASIRNDGLGIRRRRLRDKIGIGDVLVQVFVARLGIVVVVIVVVVIVVVVVVHVTGRVDRASRVERAPCADDGWIMVCVHFAKKGSFGSEVRRQTVAASKGTTKETKPRK